MTKITKRTKFVISFRWADGTLDKITVPYALVGYIVEVLHRHRSVYDIRVQGMKYGSWIDRYGGMVIEGMMERD